MGKFVLTAELKLQAPGNINSVVNNINSRLKDIQINFKLQDAGKAVAGLNDVTRAADKTSVAVNKMGYAFGVSLKRFAAFSLASRAIGLFSNRLAGAIDDAINFQDQMVRLSQITGETTKDLRYIADEIGNLATKFGVTSKSILSATDILAQAGLQANDLRVAINALAKTELAPTFGKIEDTAEGAVAILAQFGEGVGALERQLGSINRVAAQFAVESEDLISVIRRTGGVFKASGGSLEELLAVFTSVRATTRESAESIATGLRTIFTRIQRPQTIEYLKQFGVQLTDLNGKFVGPYKAVEQLSQALAQFGEGDIRFIAIAEELGGYRQIGKVIPLIRQFAMAEQARQVAVEGGASLDEDAAKSQESLRRQFIKTQESFLKLIRDIGDTTSFQTMIKVGLNLANAFIKVADSIKPIIPLIGALAAIKFAQGIGNFASGIGAGFRQIVGPRAKNAGGKIHAFARGGLVPGSGNRDTVPAMLSPGEFVIRKSSVNKIGAGRLAAMNENRYADGGPVLASTLPSVAVQKRIKSASSKEAREQPEKFENGYYLTDTDTIIFEKKEYGLQATPTISAKNFEKKVAEKTQGKLADSPNAPVDVINSKNYGNLEVRNRIRATSDHILLDKFLRQRIKNGQKLIENKPQKDKNLKFPDVVSVVYNTGKLFRKKFEKLNFGGFIRQYADGTTGKGVTEPTDEEIKLYESLGSASGIEKFLPSGVTKKSLLRSSSRFNYGIFKSTLAKAQAAKTSTEQQKAQVQAALPQYGAAILKKQIAYGNELTDTAGRKFGLTTLYMGADDSKNIQDAVVKDGAVKLINDAASYMLKGIGGTPVTGATTTPNLSGITGSIFEAALRKIDGLPDDGDPDTLNFDFPRGLGPNAAKIFGADAAKLVGLKTDAKFASTDDARESIRAKVKRDLNKTQGIQKKFFGGIIQKFAKGSTGKGVEPSNNSLLSLLQAHYMAKVPTSLIGKMVASKEKIRNNLENVESYYGVRNAKIIGSGAESVAFDIGKRVLKISPRGILAEWRQGMPAFDTPNIRGVARYFKIKQFGLLAAALQSKLDLDEKGRTKQATDEDLEKLREKISKQGYTWADDTEFNSGYKRGKLRALDGIFRRADGSQEITNLPKGTYIKPEKATKFATGGPAPSDTVPALLTPGEFVINKQSAQRIGYGNLNRMNKQGVTGFASGGPVGFRFGGDVAKQNITSSFTRTFSNPLGDLSKSKEVINNFLNQIKDVNTGVFNLVKTIKIVNETGLTPKERQVKGNSGFSIDSGNIAGRAYFGNKTYLGKRADKFTAEHETSHQIDYALGKQANPSGNQIASKTSGTFQNKVALELQKSLAAEGNQSAYRLDLGELWADAMAKAPPEVRKILASTTDAAKGSKLLAEYFEKAGGPVAGLADLSADEFGGIQDPKKRQAAQAQENIKKSKANIQVQRTDIANQQKKISGVDTKIASQQSIQTQAKQRQAEINAAQTKLSGKMAPQGTDPAQFTDAQKKAVERFNILQKAYDEQQKILNNSEKAIKGLDASRKKYQAKIDSATKTIKEERENIRANSQNIQAYRDVTGKPSAKSERQAGTSLRQRVPMSPSGPGGGGRPPINPPVPPSSGGPGGGGPGGGSDGPSEKDANASFVKFAAFTGAINTVGTSLIEMGKNADGTSTAFSRIAEASLGIINQVSAVVFALQQFGVSLNIKGLKQFFGSGPGSLGDKLTGNRLANFVGPMQPKGPGLISRGFSSAKQGVASGFGAIKSGLSSGYTATKQAVTNPLATIKSGYTAAREKVSNIKDNIGNFPTSIRKQARSFLGTEKMKGSLENFIENTSGKISSGIKNAPGRIGGFIKSAPSNIASGFGKAIGGIKGAGANIGSNILGVISKVAGPLAAIGGSAVLVSGAFNSVISAAYDYENQIKSAVEAGNAEKAAELAGKQSDLQAANTTRTLGAGIGSAIGFAFGGPIGSAIGAVAGAALGTVFANLAPGLAQTINEFFGGDTKKSVEERARADGLAAKYTLEHAANLKEADAATQQWQAGLITTEQAMMVWGRNAKNAAAAFSAEQSAVAASQANKSTGFQANLRDVFSLGGTLFENSTARNTRIDKENAARSKESFKALSTEFEGLMSGPLAKNLFATGKSGQEVMDAMAQMNPEIFAAMNQAANSSDEALSKMGKQALETAKRNAEASAKQAENQRKYLESLNLGLFNVVSGAQAAASALELIAMQGEGVDPLTKSMKVLEAATTSQAAAMDPKQIEAATQEFGNALRRSGLEESQVQKNVSALRATSQAQAGLGTSLEIARGRLQQSAVGGNPEEIKKALIEAATANVTDEQQKQTIRDRLGNINLEDSNIITQLAGGDVSGILKAASEQLTQATKEQVETGNLLAKNNQALAAIVMKRIEAEKQAIDAANEAVDVELEMAKVREQFGGTKVTSAQQRLASAQRGMNILRGTGFSVGGGGAQDFARAGSQIQQELLALEKRRQTGTFTDVDKQRETQLLQAQSGLTGEAKRRLELAKEETDIVKKKVSLEKSALEKMLGGDVIGAIEDMMASSAAKILETGDAGLARAFGSKALLGGLKNLEEIGASSQTKEIAARTASSTLGLSPRMAQAFAGTTPEEKAANQQVDQATRLIEQQAKDQATLAQERTNTAIAFEQQSRAQVLGAAATTPMSAFPPVVSPAVSPEKAAISPVTQPPIIAPSQATTVTPAAPISPLIAAMPNYTPPTPEKTAPVGPEKSRGDIARDKLRANIRNAIGAAPANTAQNTANAGVGISPEVVNTFSSSVNSFVAAVDKLQNFKLNVQLDPTNININLNGGSFLNTLSKEIKNSVLDIVTQEIPKYKLDNSGKLTKGGIV